MTASPYYAPLEPHPRKWNGGYVERKLGRHGYFRLHQRGMHWECFPVGDFRFLGHSAAESCGLPRSLRNSAAKARAFGSRLPSV